MNKVILCGRLTRDPEVRYSQGERQTAIARYTLAVDRRNARRSGAQQNDQTADFIQCVAFYQTAEFICKYFDKGTPIIVEGALKQNNYKDHLGVQHYSYQVLVNRAYFAGKREVQPAAAAPVQAPAILPAATVPTAVPASSPATAAQPATPSSLSALFADCSGVELVLDDDDVSDVS